MGSSAFAPLRRLRWPIRGRGTLSLRRFACGQSCDWSIKTGDLHTRPHPLDPGSRGRCNRKLSCHARFCHKFASRRGKKIWTRHKRVDGLWRVYLIIYYLNTIQKSLRFYCFYSHFRCLGVSKTCQTHNCSIGLVSESAKTPKTGFYDPF